MADGIINIVKPLLIAELEKNADIDSILKKIKDQLSPVVNTFVGPIKLLPAILNPDDKLKKIINEAEKQIDTIDLPQITEDKKTEIKEKLKKLVNELIFPTPEGATATSVPTTTEETKTQAPAEVAPTSQIKAGLDTLTGNEQKEAVDNIMEMLKKTGLIDQIQERMNTPPAPPATTTPAPPATTQVLPPAPPATTPPVGGAKKKNRRKTKKNIRRQNKSYTKFGRKF
jgi:hypothetical protein